MDNFTPGAWNSALTTCRLFVALMLLCCGLSVLRAAPTTGEEALVVVQHWLAQEAAPLHTPMSRTIAGVTGYTDNTATVLYYVVALSPTGYVLVSADDQLEPIIAFAPLGCYDPSPTKPLETLVCRDLAQRLAAVTRLRTLRGAAPGASLPPAVRQAQAKWQLLLRAATRELATVSDPRVDPLTQSQWGQQTVNNNSSAACFNYYTPPYAAGNPANYPCGCVATALAQLMRFWQYPQTGVGTATFGIVVDGKSQQASLRGGDGQGGAYAWGDMLLNPASPAVTALQCQAIGALCADAGTAASLSYSSQSTYGYFTDTCDALNNVFHYHAVLGGGMYNTDIGSGLMGMVNPNLDAGMPVFLGIEDYIGTNGGHAMICDGYGWVASTLYHHLNMGWYGDDTAWYNLPDIDSNPSYNAVEACIYNVDPLGSGEIISGRVLDAAGNPVAGATVTAVGGGTTYPAVTSNSRGIYALTHLPSATGYTLTAVAAGLPTRAIPATTGISTFAAASSGNVWGADFHLVEMEADVSPRPDGDGQVTMDDWVQVGRFVVGLDTPSPSEFQRADCAPRATLGDGQLTLDDWVQAGRYAVGLDPLTPAGGPMTPGASSASTELSASAQMRNAACRMISLASPTLAPRRNSAVQVRLSAQGDENALAFTLHFNPKRAKFLGVITVGPAGAAALNVNANGAPTGAVGVALMLPLPQTFARGEQPVVEFTFQALTPGGTPLSFSDDIIGREVVGATAAPLPVCFRDGVLAGR